MGDPPDGMTLDRKNNNGPYSPENCQWATRKEQVRNRRVTPMDEYNGMNLSIADWADFHKLPYKAIWQRYRDGKRGEALFSPFFRPGGRKKHVVLSLSPTC